MIQLTILSGKTAGDTFVARRFPVRIGRDAASDLRIEADGVWNEHARLNFSPEAGILLHAQSDALVAVNGAAATEAVLRNGDVIELGSLKLRFWLTDTQQISLRFRDWLTWSLPAIISAFQIAIIYWLAD